jgi:PAS domain S-box-containing protein
LIVDDMLVRGFLESVPDAMVIVTKTGTIVLLNSHAERLFGYPREELVGQRSEILLPERFRQRHERHRGACLANSPPGEMDAGVELLGLRKNGEEFPIEIRCRALETEHEMLVSTSIRDVTERKCLERALQENNSALERQERERGERYLDTAQIILLALDLDGRITLVNRYACAALGWTADELLGRDWIETCRPARLRGALRTMFQKVVGGGDLAVVDPIVTKSGEERLIEWRHTLLRDNAGSVSGIFSSGADITERNAAVDALRTAEERTRFALTNADVGIWDMNFATGVIRWSEILEAQYGLLPGTFGGTFEAFVERIHPADRELVLATVEEATKSGGDFSLHNRSIWPDGSVRVLSGSGRIHLGEHGEPVRGVGISLDVTERRSLEEQFLQAQKMEAIGRLVGGVAHDFNNLLTVILGYCELVLADRNLDDLHKADIAQIHRAGGRAVGLTRQLLAFSRKQVIEPTLLDLNVVVADMRPMLGRLIREDVAVVLRLGPGLATVKADSGQIEQIVMNLSVNALDAMPNGGTLTIETDNVELDQQYAKTHLIVEPGSYVALIVTDTGTGLAPEAQARLFEPFFTTKEPGEGTGLGLATVLSIVTQSGGSIDVRSEVGKGSSFSVYFPTVPGEPIAVGAQPPVASGPAATQTVLVVDDEEGLRELARRLLEREGYTVLIAASADEALQLFARNPSIHVLVTDVVMPGASGAALTNRLIERRPGLKVIYMSGYTDEAIVHHGVRRPGITFLRKPFTADTLARKVREVLRR